MYHLPLSADFSKTILWCLAIRSSCCRPGTTFFLRPCQIAASPAA